MLQNYFDINSVSLLNLTVFKRYDLFRIFQLCYTFFSLKKIYKFHVKQTFAKVKKGIKLKLIKPFFFNQIIRSFLISCIFNYLFIFLFN